jgi:uncharacterized protein YkwD
MTRRALAFLLLAAGCGDQSPKPLPPVINSNQTLLEAHNAERAAARIAPLVHSARLMNVAQAHADWMNANKTMSHRGENGSTFSDRLRKSGYIFKMGGENIAAGQRNVQEVMNSWMSSNGHRNNILRGTYKEMGWGRSGNYWCVLFGTPN